MHCLSEVSRERELPHRTRLERGLSQWLLFEYEFKGSVHLAREMEFPEQALGAAFREGSDEMKEAILRTVLGRAVIPLNVIELEASWLGDEDGGVRRAAVKVLGGQSALPDEILKAVAVRLGDEYLYIRKAAVEALRGRSALPGEILKAVAAWLGHKDWYVQQAAEATLRKQRDFYHELLNGPHVMSLYRILLRLSFEEQLIWYIEDGDSCVNVPEDIRRISISNHNNYVEAMVNARPANYPSICSQ